MLTSPFAVAWALAGAALALLPFPAGRIVSRRQARPWAQSRIATRPLALIVLGAACVTAAGPGPGLVLALVLCPLTATGLAALAGRPTPVRADRGLALSLDLTAAALRSGRPLPDALDLAVSIEASETAVPLRRVAGLLRLGADPVEAWAPFTAGALRPVAAVAIRSASSGIMLAAAFDRLAVDLRAEALAAAAARAHRAGVLAMGPLAACFLPSFVCLGIVPVVVGTLRATVGVLP